MGHRTVQNQALCSLRSRTGLCFNSIIPVPPSQKLNSCDPPISLNEVGVVSRADSAAPIYLHNSTHNRRCSGGPEFISH
ncbi:hypothetical protein AMEX_G12878 [Astyanax mexicanus]|uniref:Uncharacterized protein n=1 Tax=Astyanax mexicanus TaxID=7994 RepID=A0A8T2LK73_ASTMX|nr:hypothetical protein AMEX_G12878 [Astyanax mexicanus]